MSGKVPVSAYWRSIVEQDPAPIVVCDLQHTIVYMNPQENRDTYTVALRDGDGQLIGYYEKHEYRTPEDIGGKKDL